MSSERATVASPNRSRAATAVETTMPAAVVDRRERRSGSDPAPLAVLVTCRCFDAPSRRSQSKAFPDGSTHRPLAPDHPHGRAEVNGTRSRLDGVPRTSDGQDVTAVIAMLTRRCAWCNRAWTSNGWVAGPAVDPERETSTICPACVTVLQRLGASR
jgi:hypothetical protein